MNVPVRLSGRILGEVPVRVDTEGALIVGVHRRFFDLVEPFARVPAPRSSMEWWTQAELASEGFVLTFDVSRVVLELEVDPAARLERRHSLGARYSADEVTARPEAYSGGVNVRGRSVYERDGTELPGGPVYLLRLEPFMNALTWVLEGAVEYDSAASAPPELSEYRAVHDFVPQRLRLEAGTLRYPTIATQGRADIVGLAVSRRFELDPDRPPRSDAAEFFLERGGNVKVFLNDRRIFSDTLQPGPHRLDGVPYAPGRNEVRVESEGETLELIVPHDSDLLSAGLSDMSAAVGVLKDRFDSPAASSFFRRGIADRWTAGAYTHLDPDTQAAGLESTNAFAVGSFRTTVSASRARTEWDAESGGQRWGYGASLTYRFTVSGERISSVIVSCAGRSRFYSAAGELKAGNTYFGDASASLGLRLGRSSNVSIGLRGNKAYEEDRDSLALSVSGRTRLGKTIQFFAGAQANLIGTDTPGPRGTLMLAYYPEGNAAVRGSISQGIGDGTTTAAVSGEGRRSGSGLRWRAEATRAAEADQPYRADGSVLYSGNRGEVQFSSRSELGGQGMDPGYRIEGGAETAVLFAGSTVAIGSPVNDGFVLVRKHPSLEDAIVGVRTGEVWGRRTDFLGPAAIGGYASYRFQRLTLDAERVSEDVDVGNLSYLLYPTYRSGYSITVGTGPIVYAGGTLADSAGRSLILAPFEARSEDGAEPVRFFTDESGAFEVYGLKPGAWLLISPRTGQRARIVIPEDARGYFDLGGLTMGDS